MQRIRKLIAFAEGATGDQLRDALQRARRLAEEYWGDAYVARMAPVAWRTWESTTQLLSASAESPAASLEFPHPVEIVGLHPVAVIIAPNAPGPPGLVVPTLDDLLVSINWDQEQSATAAQDQTAPSGRSSFVTASSLKADTRLWCIRIESPKPVLNFTWRWKQGINVFADSILSVACFVRPLPKNGNGVY